MIIEGLLADRGEEPVDAFLDVKAVKNYLKNLFLASTVENVLKLLRFPGALTGLSMTASVICYPV